VTSTHRLAWRRLRRDRLALASGASRLGLTEENAA
jgi:hypothetical protein